MRRRHLLALLVLAAPVAFCARPRPAVATPSAPGIVVVCLDTLRADALALDSDRPVRMPRFEAFARDGVAFADAVSPASWTVPSVTSLLTGLDPGHTGVYGLANRLPEIPRCVPTIAEHLAAAGWDTAALTTGGWFGQGSPTLRGFRDGCVGLDLDPEAVLAAWDRRRVRTAPFFLFLHSLGAHDPYVERGHVRVGRPERPEPFVGDEAARMRRLDEAVRGRTRPTSSDLAWAFEAFTTSGSLRERQLAAVTTESWGRISLELTRWLDDEGELDPGLAAVGERLRVAYAAGLEEADRTFGRILDGLDHLGLPAGTVVIVVGDHGEAFGEHRTLNHARRLYDEVVRVPMVVHAPGRLGEPRRVHGTAGLVDVAPTIFALAGVAPPPGLDGVSLLGAGAGPLPDRVLRGFEERGVYDADGTEHVLRLASIRTAAAKAIVWTDPRSGAVWKTEVFDLTDDPLEQRPIPPGDPRLAALGPDFRSALDALLRPEAPTTLVARAGAGTR